MFLWSRNVHKEQDIYLLRFISGASGGYKTDFNFNNITATLSFYFDSSVKNSPANVIKVSAASLKLVSFSPFDRHDGNKPEKITFHSFRGMALAYEHCVTIKHVNHKKSNRCQATS